MPIALNTANLRAGNIFASKARAYSQKRVRILGGGIKNSLLRYYGPNIATAAAAIAIAISGSDLGALAIVATGLLVSSGALAAKGVKSTNRFGEAIASFAGITHTDTIDVERAAKTLHNLSLEDPKAHHKLRIGIISSPSRRTQLMNAVDSATSKAAGSISEGDTEIRNFFDKGAPMGGEHSTFADYSQILNLKKK
ncbi:MAG: hypothetical protein KJ732_04960 [Candidatus Margulisbacteria bacterium]|nr:hypothetical protein [Candidatus Margulisiibacteriota bacterium]